MVEGNSLYQDLIGIVVVSPRLRTWKSGRLERVLLQQQMSIVVMTPGVRVAESAMEPPSLHPEPGRAPWQRRRVLRG